MAEYVYDLDGVTAIGIYASWKGQKGPLCLASAPMDKITKASPVRDRIIKVIAESESPVRHPVHVGVPIKPRTAGWNAVQSYEWNASRGVWMSAGCVQAVSFNGNLQRLLLMCFADDPESEKLFNDVGFFLENGKIMVDGKVQDDEGEILGERWRNPVLNALVHRILGRSETHQAQLRFAWELIEKGFPVIKKAGWWDAVQRNARLMLMCASLTINAGPNGMGRALVKASGKTPEALTAARLALFSAYHQERAKRELATTLVSSDESVLV